MINISMNPFSVNNTNSVNGINYDLHYSWFITIYDINTMFFPVTIKCTWNGIINYNNDVPITTIIILL